MKLKIKVMFIILLIFFGVVLYLTLKAPTNSADWQTQYKVLPTVSMSGDVIQVTNLRDFRYNDNGTVAEIRYLDEEYQLSKFKQAWYGISHFSDKDFAHVFISFEFEDQKYLVVSIEARLETKHVNGYSPVKGAFREFNKTVVLATEQDVIGLRTHIRKERVYLYPLKVPELYTKPLLLNFLREAQVLTRKPVFYNTLIDNCMTGLLAQSDQFSNVFSWLDLRIVFPGGSDEIAHELGFIDNSVSLEEMRQSSIINPLGYYINDEFFSEKIR